MRHGVDCRVSECVTACVRARSCAHRYGNFDNCGTVFDFLISLRLYHTQHLV